jgi:N-acetylglucosaminyl-diphospho-decaprenol L-rhamnosyltransferase
LPSSNTPERLPAYLVHWQAPEWCARAAASLLESNNIEVDLTVVDNGCRAEQPSLRDLVPDGTRVLVAAANLGYAGGANLAFEDWLTTRTDDYCLIGSHDLQVAPETVATLVATARAYPSFGILAPELDRRSPASREDTEAGPQPLGWVSGTAMLIGRQCALDVGRFDELFSSYVEDVDFCWRAREAGWRVGFVPGARAYGLGSASPRAREYIAANRILLERKHHGTRGMCGALATLARQLGRHLAGSWAWWRSPADRSASRSAAAEDCRALTLAAQRIRAFSESA